VETTTLSPREDISSGWNGGEKPEFGMKKDREVTRIPVPGPGK
jgi:hypothetical protein